VIELDDEIRLISTYTKKGEVNSGGYVGVPCYLRPPPDPYLRKGRPIVNSAASKTTGAAELLNRGQQLLLELDRQQSRLHDAVRDALSPDPQSWRQVKKAKTDYDLAYAELIRLSKRLNQLLQTENPELIYPQRPPKAYKFEG
jgi:hypothetical protein